MCTVFWTGVIVAKQERREKMPNYTLITKYFRFKRCSFLNSLSESINQLIGMCVFVCFHETTTSMIGVRAREPCSTSVKMFPLATTTFLFIIPFDNRVLQCFMFSFDSYDLFRINVIIGNHK